MVLGFLQVWGVDLGFLHVWGLGFRVCTSRLTQGYNTPARLFHVRIGVNVIRAQGVC